MDWEGKRRELFGSMSAHMKALWCRPVPGSRLQGQEEEEERKWPDRLEEPKDEDREKDREKYEEDKRNWEVAMDNFALLVIDPSEVDYVELGVIPNRRTRFERKEGGKWGEDAVVP